MVFVKALVATVCCIGLFIFGTWCQRAAVTNNSPSIRDIPIGPIGVTINQLAEERAACEEYLPRNQECVFVYTFVPPDEQLKEIQNE